LIMKRFEKVINYSPYFHLAVGLALAICGWSTSGVGAEVDQSAQTDVAKPVAEIETTIESVADLVSPDTWPMFRGTQGLSGVAPGKLSTSFKLAWSFATEDPIKSTAAIVGGKVYFGSDDGWVYALDLNSGSLLWKHETKGPVESSPLFLDGKIYVGSGDGFLYALNAADGVLIWKYETGDQILGAPNWALAPDGKSKWILAGSYDFLLHCVDSVTGKVVWTYESDNYINGSPSSAGGVTVFGGCDAMLRVIQLCDGVAKASLDGGGYIAGSVALDPIHQEAFYGHYDNEFLCMDLKKGELKWRYRSANFPYFSSPAFTDEYVIVGGRDRKLHCLNRNDGEPVWIFRTRGKVDSSPVICDGKVVVGSEDGRLYVVDYKTGESIWSFEIGEALTASPAIASGWILIGSEDGSLYAFSPDLEKTTEGK
jgi:eukaryotic-like serine/threonine-protein kinase